MQQSGTKLVLVLVGLALLLGLVSWWYRYEEAHRASQFWGPEASRLIAESEGLELTTWDPGPPVGFSNRPSRVQNAPPQDLSQARGQVHLRHAFLSDHNYVWGDPLDTSMIDWRWTLRFYEGEKHVGVLLSKEMKAIGKYDLTKEPTARGEPVVVAYSCEPMSESLKQYFGALGLLAKPPASAASTGVE